jgi:hypothetical protein
MSILLTLFLPTILAQDQFKPDLGSTITTNRLALVHGNDFGRLAMPVDVIGIYQHGAMLRHILDLYAELHSVQQERATNWWPEHLYYGSERAAFNAIRNANGTQPFPEADWNDHVKGQTGLHGPVSVQQQVVRSEIDATKAELNLILYDLDTVIDRFSHVPIDTDSGRRRRHSFGSVLGQLNIKLSSLDLEIFKKENKGNKQLLYDEIFKILNEPNFIFSNDEHEEAFLVRANCTRENPNYPAMLHLCVNFQSTCQVSFDPWTAPASRDKRQALLAAAAGGILGAFGSNFLADWGLGTANYASKKDISELLHGIHKNENAILKITEFSSELKQVDQNLINRQKYFYKHISHLSGKMYRLTLQSDFHDDMSLLRPLIEMYKSKVQQIVKASEQTANGKYPSALIPLKNVKAPLKKLYKKAKGVGYEAVTDDLRILLATQVKLVLIDARLVFLADVPLKRVGKSMARLFQIPKGQSLAEKGILYSLNLKDEYFQIDEEKKLFSPLSRNAFQQCHLYDPQVREEANLSTLSEQSFDETILFCPANTQGFRVERNIFKKYSEHSCLGAILSRNKQNVMANCQFKIRPLKQEVVVRQSNNRFHVFGPPEFRRVYCYVGDNLYHSTPKYYLTNSFNGQILFLHLKPHCYLKSSQHEVYGELSPGSNLMTTAPIEINFNDNELFETIQRVTKYQFKSANQLLLQARKLDNETTFDTDLDRLKQLDTQLKKIKKIYNSTAPFHVHPTFQYAQSISVLLISLLISVCLLYFMFRYVPRWMEQRKIQMWQRILRARDTSGSHRWWIPQFLTRAEMNEQPPPLHNAMGERAVVATPPPDSDNCKQCQAAIARLTLAAKQNYIDIQNIKRDLQELQLTRNSP